MSLLECWLLNPLLLVPKGILNCNQLLLARLVLLPTLFYSYTMVLFVSYSFTLYLIKCYSFFEFFFFSFVPLVYWLEVTYYSAEYFALFSANHYSVMK